MIDKGYVWDGPSDSTIDTKDFMRGSLVHDALCQLMRGGQLDGKTWREKADDVLESMCVEDAMFKLRAWYVHRGVRLAAGPAANPYSQKKHTKAP